MKEKPKKKKSTDYSCESDCYDGNQEGILVDGAREVKQPGVFVKDIYEFTQFVVDQRSLDPSSYEVHFGLDDGQGLLKIMEIIKEKDSVLETEDKKRSRYTDGVCQKSSKLSSVKKMFVVGLVPNIQELYFNVKAMLDEIRLEGINFSFCADIKIYLCLCGKQTASCLHPCPYCEGVMPWDKNTNN